MRLLLDTHALIWWLLGDTHMPIHVRSAVENSAEVFVSAATVWEIATKYRLGKLAHAAAFAEAVPSAVASQGFLGLPVSLEHAALSGSQRGAHKDPFDRMLIAQAMLEDLTLVSNEASFDAFGIRRLW